MTAVVKSARKAPTKTERSMSKSKQAGLRIKPPGKLVSDRLSFVGRDHGKHYSSWVVPLTGGFHGGCEVGKIIAHIFLKYVRDERANHLGLPSTLLGSMLAALEAKQPADEEEKFSRNGQRAGFIGELSRWIESAACRLGPSLDEISEQQLVDRLNQNLTRTDAALMAAIEAGGAQ